MVNGAPSFGEHPAVIDGYAELLTEVFGESGWGARSAVGMGSLPLGITVEIETIFEVRFGTRSGHSSAAHNLDRPFELIHRHGLYSAGRRWVRRA